MAAGGGSSKIISLYLEVRNPQIAEAGHVEYEACCMSTEVLAGSLKQQVYKWSSFQRYSAFETFDKAIRKEMPYQMQDIKLPGKKRFGSKTPEFIESRRVALEQYMREILQIARIAEFDTHFGSKALRAFLQFDRRLDGMASSPTGTVSNNSSSTAAAPQEAPAASSNTSRRRGYRKRGTPSGRSTASAAAAPPPSSAGSGVTSHALPQSAAPAAAPAAASAPAPAPAPAAAAIAARVVPADAPAPPPARNDLLASIQRGKQLKKATTVVKGR